MGRVVRMTTTAAEQTSTAPAGAPKRGDRLGPHLAGHAFGGGALAIVSALAAGVTGAAVVLVVALAGIGAGLLGLGAGLRKRQQRRAANRTAAIRRPGLANRALSRAGLPMIRRRGPGGAGRSALGGSALGGGRSPGKFAGLRGKLPAALGGTRGKGFSGKGSGAGVAGLRIPGVGGSAPGKGRLPGGGGGGGKRSGGKLAGLRGKLPRALGGTRGGGSSGGPRGSSGAGSASGSGAGRVAKLRGKLPRALGGIKRRSTPGSASGGDPTSGTQRRWWHKLFADGESNRPEKATPETPETQIPERETGTPRHIGTGKRGFEARAEREGTMVIGKASVPKRGAGNGGGAGSGGSPIEAAAQEFLSAIARCDSSTATARQAYAKSLAAASEVLSRAYVNAGSKLGERWNDPGAQEACGIAGKQVASAGEAVIQAQGNWERREQAHLEHIANPKGKGEDGQHGLDVSKQG